MVLLGSCFWAGLLEDGAMSKDSSSEWVQRRQGKERRSQAGG
jgi:hypothetical protein